MTERRHIAVVSGSRADYGLLFWPMKRLSAESSFRLSIIVTGMHLAPEFGQTVDQFAADGFEVDARVPTLDEEDSAGGVARAIGRGVTGMTEALQRLRPDLVLLLGDRFEIFAAAQAAFVLRIPIAHLCGGDVTNGALDDAFRHSISKMAGLHFPTNADAVQRLRQLGETEDRIYNIGSTGLDYLKQRKPLTRVELESALGHALAARYLLAVFHPATLDPVPTLDQFDALLQALRGLPPEIGIVFTLANADAEGRAINAAIETFVKTRPGAHAHASLGSDRYLGLMAQAAALVGNSSSGLYEAPSLGTPSVNIGNRQDGRLRASTVIDSVPETEAITDAIRKALAMPHDPMVNPYGDGDASERLVDALLQHGDWPALVFKTFQTLPVGPGAKPRRAGWSRARAGLRPSR
jgi:UDP-N-acetylglucosamine 2-epimerase (non-hydrolysing)/GDP/UDP-N,N'-diacetylbacillosamine 2-epimerase (hydrolysing)